MSTHLSAYRIRCHSSYSVRRTDLFTDFHHKTNRTNNWFFFLQNIFKFTIIFHLFSVVIVVGCAGINSSSDRSWCDTDTILSLSPYWYRRVYSRFEPKLWPQRHWFCIRNDNTQSRRNRYFRFPICHLAGEMRRKRCALSSALSSNVVKKSVCLLSQSSLDDGDDQMTERPCVNSFWWFSWCCCRVCVGWLSLARNIVITVIMRFVYGGVVNVQTLWLSNKTIRAVHKIVSIFLSFFFFLLWIRASYTTLTMQLGEHKRCHKLFERDSTGWLLYAIGIACVVYMKCS